MALYIEKLIPLSSRNYTGCGDRQLSGSEFDTMGFRSVPQPELQLDIPFDSRQDAPMILFLHRC
jgi:hypothetical protein